MGFYIRRGYGDTIGISDQDGGAIQGFETHIMTLGFCNKFLHPGRVMRGQKWVFASEGARGVPEVTLTKRVGQLKILKPLFRFWVF